MSPAARRAQQRRAAWLRDLAIVAFILFALAATGFTVLFTTLPVTLPAPAEPAKAAAIGPAHSQIVHPRETLKP